MVLQAYQFVQVTNYRLRDLQGYNFYRLTDWCIMIKRMNRIYRHQYIIDIQRYSDIYSSTDISTSVHQDTGYRIQDTLNTLIDRDTLVHRYIISTSADSKMVV